MKGLSLAGQIVGAVVRWCGGGWNAQARGRVPTEFTRWRAGWRGMRACSEPRVRIVRVSIAGRQPETFALCRYDVPCCRRRGRQIWEIVSAGSLCADSRSAMLLCSYKGTVCASLFLSRSTPGDSRWKWSKAERELSPSTGGPRTGVSFEARTRETCGYWYLRWDCEYSRFLCSFQSTV